MPGGLFNFLGALESSKTHNVSPKKLIPACGDTCATSGWQKVALLAADAVTNLVALHQDIRATKLSKLALANLRQGGTPAPDTIMA